MLTVDGTTFLGFSSAGWSAEALMDDVAREGAAAGAADEGGGGYWWGDLIAVHDVGILMALKSFYHPASWIANLSSQFRSLCSTSLHLGAMLRGCRPTLGLDKLARAG